MTWLVYEFTQGSLSWSCAHGLAGAHQHLASLIIQLDLPDNGTWFCKEGHR